MGNGQVEGFNRTVIGMFGTLQPSQKADWKSHVATVVHAEDDCCPVDQLLA